MNALQSKQLLVVETRKYILKNQIVLIVPESTKQSVKENPKVITSFQDLTDDQVKDKLATFI